MTQKFIWFNAALILLITIISFILSYTALRELSLEHLYSNYPKLSFLWPLLLDFTLIAMSVSIIAAKIQKDSVVKHWLLVIIYTILTMVFNIIHAPDGLLPKVLAVIPPMSLFFSFEVFLHQFVSYKLFNEEEKKKDVISKPKKVEGLEKFRTDKRKKLEKLIKLKDSNIQDDEIIKRLKVTPQTFETYMSELEQIGVLNGRSKVQIQE